MLPALQRIVDWLRAGYPQGVPEHDYVPLFALLHRRLSDEEVRDIGRELVEKGIIPAGRIDVGAEYLRVADELASEPELARVSALLRQAGWAIDDAVAGKDEDA